MDSSSRRGKMGPGPEGSLGSPEQKGWLWFEQSRDILDTPVEWEYVIYFTSCSGTMRWLLPGDLSMTKAELVEKVADKIQLTKKQTESVVNILLNCITEALSEGDKVELRGFGSFRIRNRNPREGRNPKTGDAVQIPAKRVPFFKAGKELREMVDGQ